MKNITMLVVIMLGLFSVAANAFSELDSSSIQRDLDGIYYKYKNFHKGKNASYIPALQKIDPNLFAIVVVTAEGRLFQVGDVDKVFAIESIAKPFMYALALKDNGDELNSITGLNATGAQFNSVMALEQQSNHLENPYVNAGAIQVTDYIKGKDSAEKWHKTIYFMSELSGSQLNIGAVYYQSESETNQHNLGIAYLLASYGLIKGDPVDALDRYTKACSVVVTAKQLAVMGSVLANGGISPFTKQRIIAAKYVKHVLSQMTINGMYENSGKWWTEVGLPSKSGVGGGVLSIAPNKLAIVVYSPPLDKAGNSVKGQLVIKELSQKWKLHLLSSEV